MKRNNFIVKSLSLATIASIIAPNAVSAQDVCEAFARYGIYDSQTTTSDTDKAASFRTWFCQNKFESKQSADAAGLSLGYGGFKLGFDSNSESWANFSSNYCRDESYSSKYRQATLSFVQTINANASSNMLACFLRGGLHARVVPGARTDTFYVQARLTPTGTTTKAIVTAFAVIGGVCSGPMGVNGYEITSAGAEQICQRAGEQAIDISLTASEQVNWDTPRGLKRILFPPPFIALSTNTRDRDGVKVPSPNDATYAWGSDTLLDRYDGATYIKPIGGISWASWSIDHLTPGLYEVLITYAAAESRPLRLLIDGKVALSDVARETTGPLPQEGWKKREQRSVGQVRITAANSTLRLETAASGQSWPHFKEMRLVFVGD